MDPLLILPEAAKLFDVPPSVLLFWLFVTNRAASMVSRAIPDTATGFPGFLRRLLAIIGTEVSTKIAPGIKAKDVTKAALTTPTIAAKVEAATGAPVPTIEPDPAP